MLSEATIFIAGYARLPQGMAAKNLYDSMTITAEVDKKYGVIVDAECTLVTELGRDFMKRLLKGHSLLDGTQTLIEMIQVYYKGKAASALVAAVKDLEHRFHGLSR